MMSNVDWSNYNGNCDGIEHKMSIDGGVDVTTIALTTDTSLVAYVDTDNNKPHAILAKIGNTNEIISGEPLMCSPHSAIYMSMVKLSSTRAFVTYVNIDQENKIYGVLISVIGEELITSTPICLNEHHSYYASSSALSEDKVLLCYTNSNDNDSLYTTLITVHEDSILIGGPVKCGDDVNCSYVSTVTLSDTEVLVAYNTASPSGLYTKLITVRDTDIHIGESLKCNDVDSHHICMSVFDDHKVALAYVDYTDRPNKLSSKLPGMDHNDNCNLYTLILTIADGEIKMTDLKISNHRCVKYCSITAVSETDVFVHHSDDLPYLNTTNLHILDSEIVKDRQLPHRDINWGVWNNSEMVSGKVGDKVLLLYNLGQKPTLYGKVLVS